MNVDAEKIGTGLRRIRRRRWYLWLVSLAYVPIIWMTLVLTRSNRAVAVVYCIWIVFLAKAVLPVAFVLCPRCGNRFHMKGFFPRYRRRCLHCGLHITADKKFIQPPPPH
ncbi:MAG TPA: hypothetical protein VMJ66_09480 [Geobacteraceae bacterium]|nr:hypothetical protein [Geobacteraceae bacterium]